jgi:hypothetical protein
LVIGPTL